MKFFPYVFAITVFTGIMMPSGLLGMEGLGAESNAIRTETIMLPGDVPLEMVWIPPGTFMMGSPEEELGRTDTEGPQHQVTLSSGFWMGKYLVTRAQWEAVMDTRPWANLYFMPDTPEHPAAWISWDDAKAYVAALNDYTGMTFRLPSEAEWEYAARAGTTTRFYWGDDPTHSQIIQYAWWRGNTLDIDNRNAQPVGQKRPNAFGLFDMSGNVWEWCEDDWHWTYEGAPTDGSAWIDSPRSDHRVRRGGSWSLSDGSHCRSANRLSFPPGRRYYRNGFRLARSAPDQDD